MRTALKSCVLLLFSVVLVAQTAPTGSAAPAKKKRSGAMTSAEARELRQAMAAQQQQIQQMQEEMHRRDQLMEQLQQALAQAQANASTAQEKAAAAQSFASQQGESVSKVQADLADVKLNQANAALNLQEEQKKTSLSFRIGKVDFTPAGFLDFSNVFRSTNTGNPVSTNFGAIPFSNTVAGHLTEYRGSAQHSRLILKAHSQWGDNDITGYIEADFNGNDAANVFVGTNPHTNRLRHYYMDVKHNKWEVLAGQTWSWLTPNREGVSTNHYVTSVYDPNYNIGLTLTRAAQLRVIYHPTDHWAFGVGIENPEQYVGPGEVTYPFAFNAQLGPQFDANNLASTPNLHPDLMAKIAYDANPGGHHFHVEVAGLATSIKATVIPTVPASTFQGQTATGGGVEGAMNIEIIKKRLSFFANGYYSDGGGRYILGLGPDAVMRPVAVAGGFTAQPSLVHSGTALAGFEANIGKRNLFYAYYGGAYFQRNAFPDITAAPVSLRQCTPTGPLQNQPCIGFGYLGSANNANRALQEPTAGWTFTMWKDPNYGALAFMTQVSYITRSPWFVAAGAPKNAHLSMVFLNLRYTLP
jgi:hypothetical protein